MQVCIRSVSGSEQPVRGRRYTGGGARMVVWRAAEKDCWIVNDEKKQEKAECVICFEEFEEGDVIARLECLCRYHKVCFFLFFLSTEGGMWADGCRNVLGSGLIGGGMESVRCTRYTISGYTAPHKEWN